MWLPCKSRPPVWVSFPGFQNDISDFLLDFPTCFSLSHFKFSFYIYLSVYILNPMSSHCYLRFPSNTRAPSYLPSVLICGCFCDTENLAPKDHSTFTYLLTPSIIPCFEFSRLDLTSGSTTYPLTFG